MKRILSVLIFTVFVCVVLTLTVSAGSYNGLTYEIADGEVTITRYSGSLKEVIIPSTIEGCSVTKIGDSAFYNNSSVESVTIPVGVKEIGHDAFAYTNIESLIIPDGVVSIGSNAFYDCEYLESITLPDSVKSIGVDVLKGTAYYKKSSNWENGILYSGNHLIDVKTYYSGIAEIGGGIITISDGAFSDCVEITAIFVDENNKNYCNDESGVLYNKYKTILVCCPAGAVLTSFEVPSSVAEIKERAFYKCSSLLDITFPVGLVNIGWGAFYGCTSLVDVVIPDSVEIIDGYAFYGCSCLESVSFGQNSKLTNLGYYTFYNCRKLYLITIPEKVTNIGSKTFYGCESLTSIVIPASVKTISSDAFSSCSSLTYIRNNSDIAITVGEGIAGGVYKLIDKDGNATYKQGYVDDGNGFMFNATNLCAYAGEEKTVTLPLTDRYGSSYSLYCMAGVNHVIIPEGITKIAFNAFKSCYSLLSINIPDSVKTINYESFMYCKNLKSVAFSDNSQLISIGTSAFKYCESLASFTFPKRLATVSEELFYGCKGLTSVNIHENITSIGSSAFYNCESLTAIVLPKYLETVSEYAFYNCASLSSISIPNNVLSLGKSAFSGCDSLIQIDLPESITEILSHTFSYCDSIETVNIPESVTAVANDAFWDCRNLKFVVIPKSIAAIGETAFGFYYSSGDRLVDGFTIYGFTNSAAETYATDNDIPFKVLDNTKISGKSLYLDGGIGVRVHFEYDSEIISPESLVFNVALTNSKDNSVTENEVPLTLDTDGKSAYAIVYVPAKDINTVSIGGTLMGETVSGAKAQLDSVSEITVPTYIKELEESAKTDNSYANALNVVNAMQTYCSYADAYFNNTEIEDITLTDAEESAISEIASPRITNKTLGDIEFYSTSLLLEGTVTLRHYFKVTGDIDTTDYVVEGGSELTLSDSSVGYAYIDIENISANELGVQKTVKITNNGETTEIVFSPLNYVKLAYNDDNTALKNLVRALYRYGVKATEYAE